MKHRGIKDSIPTKHTQYLGHFRKSKNLKMGHNFAWLAAIPAIMSAASSMSQNNKGGSDFQPTVAQPPTKRPW